MLAEEDPGPSIFAGARGRCNVPPVSDDGDRGETVTGVHLVQDISTLSSPVEGFLRRHRHRVKSVLGDHRTDTFAVDFVDRAVDRRDAVAVVAYAPPQEGAAPERARVLLRRQLRYAVHLVTGEPMFTELVAGVLERPESVASAAVRELAEEAAIAVTEDAIRPLGPPCFTAPGAMTERLYLVEVELPAGALEAALATALPGDGSPFEAGAELLVAELGDALAGLAGPADAPHLVADAKTELGLRRLLERLRGARP
jgi:ADP-ribose pyrophosphatase